MDDPKFAMYLAYLAITVMLTFWVARTLHRNGKVFLRDALTSDELAESVNKLLLVGFYLLNLGYATYAMKSADLITDPTNALETLSAKIGLVMLALGTIHFINIFVLSRFRRRAQHQNLAAMVPPHLPPGRPVPQQRIQPHHVQQYVQQYNADLGQHPQQPAPVGRPTEPVPPAAAQMQDAPAQDPAGEPDWEPDWRQPR